MVFDGDYTGTGSDLPGGGLGGSTLPMIFLTPESPWIWAPGGSILTPVLVLHVSAYGASTLSPGGDTPVFFLQIEHCTGIISWDQISWQSLVF